MEIPIYMEGRTVGTVTLERQGEAVNVSADMRDAGRVVRLYVYGERAFYLGIPEPDGKGRAKLKKRIPCVRHFGFPQTPEYAAEQPVERTEKKGKRVLWHGGKPYYF